MQLHDDAPAGLDLATDLVAACRDGSLDRAAWTHESHLAVAWAIHREVGDPAMALGELRGLITAYNATSGLPAERVICHETITRYYLGAVIAVDAATPAELVAHPWCSRRAPLRHWSSAALASERARRSWLEPDLAPLPWTTATSDGTDAADITDITDTDQPERIRP